MRIPLAEIVVPGKPLGRHIDHDPRSLRYTLPASPAKSVTWERHIPILSQGQVGSCTGNAITGALGSGPLYDAIMRTVSPLPSFDEAMALAIYSAAETLDGDGPYPPNDNGSSGLSVAKVATTDGYVSGYQHATSVDAAHTAIQAGPFITGTNWMTGMDTPNAEGIVTRSGQVRGGHEYVCREYDAARDLWWFDNSWGVDYGLQGRFAYDSQTFDWLLGQGGDVTALVPVNQPAPTPTPTPAPSGGHTLTFTDDQFAAIDECAGRIKAYWPKYAKDAAAAWKAAQ